MLTRSEYRPGGKTEVKIFDSAHLKICYSALFFFFCLIIMNSSVDVAPYLKKNMATN